MNKEIINQPRAIVHSLLFGLSGTPLSIGATLFIEMKLIPLTQGQFAQVDDWNYDWLMQWKWNALKNPWTYYAVRTRKVKEGKRGTVWMHREIMQSQEGIEVDHIDHNGLNCLEENMRNCMGYQNAMNKSYPGKSKYHGVSFKGKFVIAQIQINRKKIHIGCFKNEEVAARAYDAKAKELFGEFANLNFKYL